jgi:hypothetical protein
MSPISATYPPAETQGGIQPFFLFRYRNEQAYHFNNRKNLNDFGRFRLAASQIIDKRLTWKQVLGMTADATASN